MKRILLICLFASSCVPTEAPPMKGKCTDVPSSVYIGKNTKDIKHCTWWNKIWECIADTDRWTCTYKGESPPEAPVSSPKA